MVLSVHPVQGRITDFFSSAPIEKRYFVTSCNGFFKRYGGGKRPLWRPDAQDGLSVPSIKPDEFSGDLHVDAFVAERRSIFQSTLHRFPEGSDFHSVWIRKSEDYQSDPNVGCHQVMLFCHPDQPVDGERETTDTFSGTALVGKTLVKWDHINSNRTEGEVVGFVKPEAGSVALDGAGTRATKEFRLSQNCEAYNIHLPIETYHFLWNIKDRAEKSDFFTLPDDRPMDSNQAIYVLEDHPDPVKNMETGMVKLTKIDFQSID